MNNVSEDKNSGFNRLVYEYLVKGNFEKTAAVFKSECMIDDIQFNDLPSTLLNWYNIFIETADVRSGRKYISESLNRIEGIMLKLENDKQRFSRISSMAQNMKRTVNLKAHYGEETLQCENPDQYVLNQARVPPSKPIVHNLLREYKRIDLHLPKVFIAKYCPINKILILCCIDNKVYFYNLANNSMDYCFISGRRLVRIIRHHETSDRIYLAYSTDNYSITLSRFFAGKVEEIKTIDFEVPVRSYCFANDNFLVLSDNSTLKIFSFDGEVLKILQTSRAVISIDYFGKSLLMVETNRIVEFDLTMNMEIKTLCRAKNPYLTVKGEFAFLTLSDTIQVFNSYSPGPIMSISNMMAYKDICMVLNRPAICTESEIFYGGDIIPLPSAMEISEYSLPGVSGLIVVSSEGIVTLYSKNFNEY